MTTSTNNVTLTYCSKCHTHQSRLPYPSKDIVPRVARTPSHIISTLIWVYLVASKIGFRKHQKSYVRINYYNVTRLVYSWEKHIHINQAYQTSRNNNNQIFQRTHQAPHIITVWIQKNKFVKPYFMHHVTIVNTIKKTFAKHK